MWNNAKYSVITIVLLLTMVIINGNCVICAKYKSVLSLGDKHAYLEILNKNLFHEEQNRFNKFSKLFTEHPNSICISCAYKIDLYNTNKSNWPPEKKSKKYCALCCTEKSDVFKCLSELKTAISRFTENKITGTVNICLNCSFCLDGWNDIRNFVNQLLNSSSFEELNSTTVSSSTSSTSMKKRRYSVSSKASVPLKKAKITEKVNINNNSKKTNNKKRKPARGRFNEQIQQEKIDLDEKLQHLVTVDNETIDRNMKLSFSVLTDQKMMFEIPYIACDSIPSEEVESIVDSDSSVEFESHTRSKQKRALRSDADDRKNKSNLFVDIIIDHTRDKQKKRTSERKIFKNDSDSSVEFVSHTKVTHTRTSQKKVSKHQGTKNYFDGSLVEIVKQKRTISKEIPSPKSKRKRPKKEKVVETEVFSCSKCNKILERQYTLMLHELEHENSFSPTIVIEQQDLEKILKEYKDKNNISNTQENLISQDATMEEGQLLNKYLIQEKETVEIKDKDAIQEIVEINNKNAVKEKEEGTAETKDKDAMDEKDEETVVIIDNNAIEEKAEETAVIKNKDAIEEKEEGTIEIKDVDAIEEKKEETLEIKDKDALKEMAEGTMDIEDKDSRKEKVVTNKKDTIEENEDKGVTNDKNVVVEKEMEIKNKEAIEEKEETVKKSTDEKINNEKDENKEKPTDDTQTNQDEDEGKVVDKIDSPDTEENEESENEDKDSDENINPESPENPEKTEEADEKKSDTDDDHSEEKTNDDNEKASTKKDDGGEKENDASEEKEDATEEENNRKLNTDELDDISSEEGIETIGEVLENDESNGIESENAIASSEESEYDMDPLKISNSSGGSSPDKKIIEEEDLLQKPLILTAEIENKLRNKLPDSDRFRIMEDILNNLGA